MPSLVPPNPGLLPAAREVALAAARHAAEADAVRALHPEVVEGIVDSGFARHFVPARWGGAEGGLTDLLHAAAALGEGCTSAAWCASVLAGAARMGAYLPEAGQQELWAKGADTRIAGALMPRGHAVEVPGGWRLTGDWEFTSGVGFSEWAMVCALLPVGEHGEPWFLAVPRQDYEVVDTWFNTGMRGTGSNTLVLDDVFVPRHRAFARSAVLTGRSVGSEARCHTAPLRLLSGVLFGAPGLGAARGAFQAWSGWRAPRPGPDGRPSGDSPDNRLTAARAAGRIDAAQLLLERAARVADAAAATPAETVRSPADCALAIDELVVVIEDLFRTAGSRGQLEAHPLQRIWRDVHCLASHAALRFDTAGSAYGGHLLEAAGTRRPH